MITEPLLLVGAGGHARACIDVIEQEGRFAVGGLVGERHEVGTRVLGYEVVGTDDDLPSLRDRFSKAVVVVGQIRSATIRVTLFERLSALGFALPAIVSPRAYVSRHASIGAGSMVLHGAIVNAAAHVGRNCIINSQALVEHDAEIGDHCHVSTGATVNSGVKIGARTFIGSNSSVKQGLEIGEECLIGMGCRVLQNCAARSRIVDQPRES